MKFSSPKPFAFAFVSALLAQAAAPIGFSNEPGPDMTAEVQKKIIPILAWVGVPTEHASEERYREMAEAGFTWSLPLDDTRVNVRKHLDLAAKTGIKLVLQDNDMMRGQAVEVANLVKNHPGLGAYHLKDEPATGEFAKLATVLAELKKADPLHPAYINLFPSYGKHIFDAPDFKTYVTRYLEEVKPEFLSFDHYGIRLTDGKPKLTPGYFEDLKQIRSSAQQAGIPFWAFALSTPHADCPVPTDGQLRFQVFNNLAFGARGISYFTYWTPPTKSQDEAFYGGPIDLEGKRTPTYELIKTLNGEIAKLTPTLVELTSEAVGYYRAGKIRLESEGENRVLEKMSGSPVTLGFFEGAGAQWVFIVNRSFEEEAKTTATLKAPFARLKEVDKKSGALVELARPSGSEGYELTLAPGDGRLFQVSQ